MSLSMFHASIPVLLRYLNNLEAILEKGAQHARQRNVEDIHYTAMRLMPDMFPLSRQVQIACDVAKGGGARLAGLQPPVHEDTETSFDELKGRVLKVIQYLKEIKPAQIDGSEDKEISLKAGNQELSFKGADYLLNFVLPNVFFHITTTYALLRAAGVDLGKRDFLGAS